MAPTAIPTDDSSANSGDASGSQSDADSGNSPAVLAAVVVAIVLVLVVIGAAVVIVKKAVKNKNAGDPRAGPAGFDNPLYATTAPVAHPDVDRTASAPSGSSGYMDVTPTQTTGYMDVAPQAPPASGYMDVGTWGGNAEDDGEEDV